MATATSITETPFKWSEDSISTTMTFSKEHNATAASYMTPVNDRTNWSTRGTPGEGAVPSFLLTSEETTINGGDDVLDRLRAVDRQTAELVNDVSSKISAVNRFHTLFYPAAALVLLAQFGMISRFKSAETLPVNDKPALAEGRKDQPALDSGPSSRSGLSVLSSISEDNMLICKETEDKKLVCRRISEDGSSLSMPVKEDVFDEHGCSLRSPSEAIGFDFYYFTILVGLAWFVVFHRKRLVASSRRSQRQRLAFRRRRFPIVHKEAALARKYSSFIERAYE